MGVFWFRFIVFVFLWVMSLIQESNNLAISLLFMAVASTIYFFLTIKRETFLLFMFLSVVVISHSFFTDATFFTFALLIYLAIFAVYRLQGKLLYIYIIFHLFSIIFINLMKSDHLLESIIVYSFISFLIVTTQRFYQQQQADSEKIDQMEGDIRKLKRMNISSEHAARLEERTRIMRDLHDSVGHKLTALIMKLEMLAIQTGDEQYRILKEMAEASLNETREAVSVLKSEDSEGIATVVQLIRKLESESHMVVQFTLKEGVLATTLSNDKNIQLYRIVQEALTNAMRHAESREVQVSLGKTAIGDLSFEVRNRIHQTIPFEFGFGLSNMKQRVHEIKGELSVYQTDDEFIVRGSFPIEEGEYVESANR